MAVTVCVRSLYPCPSCLHHEDKFWSTTDTHEQYNTQEHYHTILMTISSACRDGAWSPSISTLMTTATFLMTTATWIRAPKLMLKCVAAAGHESLNAHSKTMSRHEKHNNPAITSRATGWPASRSQDVLSSATPAASATAH